MNLSRARRPAPPPTRSGAVRSHGGMPSLLLNSCGGPRPAAHMSFCSDRRTRMLGGNRSAFINGFHGSVQSELFSKKGLHFRSPFPVKENSSGNTWQASHSPAISRAKGRETLTGASLPASLLPIAYSMWRMGTQFPPQSFSSYLISIIAPLCPSVKDFFIP